MLLEELRDKSEIIEYFKAQNVDITNEYIEQLKESYKNTLFDENNLTLEQLSKVAGGGMEGRVVSFVKANSQVTHFCANLKQIGEYSSLSHYYINDDGKPSQFDVRSIIDKGPEIDTEQRNSNDLSNAVILFQITDVRDKPTEIYIPVIHLFLCPERVSKEIPNFNVDVKQLLQDMKNAYIQQEQRFSYANGANNTGNGDLNQTGNVDDAYLKSKTGTLLSTSGGGVSNADSQGNPVEGIRLHDKLANIVANTTEGKTAFDIFLEDLMFTNSEIAQYHFQDGKLTLVSEQAKSKLTPDSNSSESETQVADKGSSTNSGETLTFLNYLVGHGDAELEINWTNILFNEKGEVRDALKKDKANFPLAIGKTVSYVLRSMTGQTIDVNYNSVADPNNETVYKYKLDGDRYLAINTQNFTLESIIERINSFYKLKKDPEDVMKEFGINGNRSKIINLLEEILGNSAKQACETVLVNIFLAIGGFIITELFGNNGKK